MSAIDTLRANAPLFSHRGSQCRKYTIPLASHHARLADCQHHLRIIYASFTAYTIVLEVDIEPDLALQEYYHEQIMHGTWYKHSHVSVSSQVRCQHLITDADASCGFTPERHLQYKV